MRFYHIWRLSLTALVPVGAPDDTSFFLESIYLTDSSDEAEALLQRYIQTPKIFYVTVMPHIPIEIYFIFGSYANVFVAS